MRKETSTVINAGLNRKTTALCFMVSGRSRSSCPDNEKDHLACKYDSRLLILALAFFLSMSLVTASSSQTVELSDDLGHKIRLASCPQRIVSLAPNLTEILFALGLEREMVGVTRYCDYPEEARNREIVGGLVDLNLEKIRSLKPELVLGYRGNPRRVIDRLYRQQIPVYVFNAGRTFDDLFTLITRIGQLTCRQEKASGLISSLKQQLVEIEKILPPAGQEKRVFLTLYGQGAGLWTCGRDSYLNYLILRARAKNVSGRQEGNWLVYNREKLIKEDPESILILSRNQEDFDRARNWFSAQPAFQKISAVRNNRFFFLDENLFSRFSPRLVEAYRQLIITLYNDRVARKQ